jgi:hypothetical protein
MEILVVMRIAPVGFGPRRLPERELVSPKRT